MLGYTSGWERFRHVVFWGALPNVFTGLRIGLGIAWICVATAEMLAVKSGFGYMLWELVQFSPHRPDYHWNDEHRRRRLPFRPGNVVDPALRDDVGIVMAPVKLSCNRVRKSFTSGSSETLALDDTTIDIREGEFLCLLGPSGCGKTTILNLLAGFEKPTAGTLRLNAQTIDGPGMDRGVIFQEHALFPWLTVGDNVASGKRVCVPSRRPSATKSFGGISQ